MQLYRLPNGKIIDIRAHPAMVPVKFCPRHNRMASKWHQIWTKLGESLKTPRPKVTL